MRMRDNQLQLDFGQGNEHIAEQFMHSFHNGQVPREYRKGPAFQYNQDGEVPKRSETRPYILRFPTYQAPGGQYLGINFGGTRARNSFLAALRKLDNRQDDEYFPWIDTLANGSTLHIERSHPQLSTPEFHNESGGIEIAQFYPSQVHKRIGRPVSPEPSADVDLSQAFTTLLFQALAQGHDDAAVPNLAISQQPAPTAQHQPTYQQQPAYSPTANASASPQVNNPQLQHLNALLQRIETAAQALELHGGGTTITDQHGEKITLSSSLAKVYGKARSMRDHILINPDHMYLGDEIRQRLIQPMQKLNKKTQTWETKEAGGKGPRGGERDSTTTDLYNDVIATLEKRFNLTPPLASAPSYPQAEAPLAFSPPQPGAPTPSGVAATATLLHDHEQMEGHMEGHTPQAPGATSSAPSAPPGP
ncbi:hypothetical protein [Piscirickettsia salmonis]|nr:hypothetical protein [Piscirickettsia salmonis]QNR80690.1 hypothetical protein ICC15_01180 [Piscirickettsia salmonis]WGZ72253.1 hypothetical protein E3220_12085 [Piscirickettsia salmonis EM-90]